MMYYKNVLCITYGCKSGSLLFLGAKIWSEFDEEAELWKPHLFPNSCTDSLLTTVMCTVVTAIDMNTYEHARLYNNIHEPPSPSSLLLPRFDFKFFEKFKLLPQESSNWPVFRSLQFSLVAVWMTKKRKQKEAAKPRQIVAATPIKSINKV